MPEPLLSFSRLWNALCVKKRCRGRLQQNSETERISPHMPEGEHDTHSYSAFIECMHEGVLAVNTGGYISMCNTQASTLLRRKKKHIIGSAVQNVFPLSIENGLHTRRDERPYDIVMENLHPYESNPRITYHCQRGDGTQVPIALTATPLKLEGILRGVLIIFRDITEEKQIDMLKSECIALTSHQLRTPLTAISWYVEMIRNEVENMPEQTREYFNQINEASNRMIKLINSLLNVYRIERGELSIEPEGIDLVRFTRESCDELSPQYEEKGIHLSLQLPDRIDARVDKQLLQIVLENLLTNAIKYSPDGSTVSLKLSHSMHECQFEIRDSGCGIPLKEHPHIFEKFFRAENVSSQRGVGIGLYIVHAIVKAWGGHIWFESDERHGTAFYFTMPLTMQSIRKGQALWK